MEQLKIHVLDYTSGNAGCLLVREYLAGIRGSKASLAVYMSACLDLEFVTDLPREMFLTG